jgi:release factor glutamine methyltransferase
VTDHRINLTLHKIDAIMDGDLAEITAALARAPGRAAREPAGAPPDADHQGRARGRTATIGRVDAHVIMAHLLGVDRAYLAAHPDASAHREPGCAHRHDGRATPLGHPVAYLIGKREFYSRDFESARGAHPPPRTETLVEAL